jgi:flagellar hook-associated protein 3 FlgL
MRILQSGIYDKFIQDQSRAKGELDRLTTQISSGKKIEHAYEDSSVYIDTLRLDSEINALQGVQNRTEKSKVITDASDAAMNEFDTTLIDFKTKLIQAANGTLNDDNLRSMAEELEQSKEHLINLANSSVNGQYLFSGSAVNVKPIDSEGEYHGNDRALKTLISESSEVPYSIDGASLFLGIDESVKKSVSSNVHLQNQTTSETLTTTDKVEDLLGSTGDGYFYLTGVRHDGEAFKEKITLNGSDEISKLLDEITLAYGANVKAELTENGTIMIVDEKAGNSKLDFQMVASNENVTDLDALTSKIEFTKSANSSNNDRAKFDKSGNVLYGNVALVYEDGFATSATKLSEMASQSLDGKSYVMDITDINGNAQTVTIDLSANSTFSIGGNSYNIYDADDSNGVTQTVADDFTLGQLNNVIAMVMADTLPTTNTKAAFESAIVDAKEIVDVGLNSSGALKIVDNSHNNQDISFSLYDKDTTDFTKSASLSFMSNQAVVVDNPKINFFKDLDTIIEAVREGIRGVDADGTKPNNPGLQNAISKIDSLSTHVSKAHTKLGAMSNNLQRAYDKAATLELNVNQLKSKVSDVDIAEAIVEYEQVSLNYQAMMSTIAKVNSLSLLNYLK